MEKQIDKENRKKGAKSEICAFRQRLQKEKDGRQSDTNNRCRKQKFTVQLERSNLSPLYSISEEVSER